MTNFERRKAMSVEEMANKYGWPLKIKARGVIARLVSIQPLDGGTPLPMYQFPGGVSVVSDELELVPYSEVKK